MFNNLIFINITSEILSQHTQRHCSIVYIRISFAQSDKIINDYDLIRLFVQGRWLIL